MGETRKRVGNEKECGETRADMPLYVRSIVMLYWRWWQWGVVRMSFCGCSGQSKLNSLSPELDSMGNAESFCCFRDLKMPPVPPVPPFYLL